MRGVRSCPATPGLRVLGRRQQGYLNYYVVTFVHKTDACRHMSHLPESAVLRQSGSRAHAKHALGSHALVCRDSLILCTYTLPELICI